MIAMDNGCDSISSQKKMSCACVLQREPSVQFEIVIEKWQLICVCVSLFIFLVLNYVVTVCICFIFCCMCASINISIFFWLLYALYENRIGVYDHFSLSGVLVVVVALIFIVSYVQT